MTTRLITRSLLLAAALAIAGTVRADVPQVISYQGRLTDQANLPYDSSHVDLIFTIFTDSAAGIPLWTESHLAAPIESGLFTVLLGSTTPLPDSLLTGPNHWLQITANGEPILPRTRVASAPYSYRVSTVDGATGGELTGGLILNNPDYPANRAGISRIVLSFEDGAGTIALYDPVDSKSPFAEPSKRIEILREGIVMFGATESDTNLYVAPNGDIIGRGQITMGENSSPGIQTSVLGFQNVANGDSSTIGGGSNNVTYGAVSVIAGGHGNEASGDGSVVSGGRFNSAAGPFSVIPGGEFNQTQGAFAYAAGHRAQALHDGAFVWADHTDEDFASTAPDQFIIRAAGGVGIGTDSPTAPFEVAADPGDSSVTLPTDAIAAREILDEPGLAGQALPTTISLTPSPGMQEVASVSITIPAAGYILLNGTATLELYGTSGDNRAYLQIDETAGGGPVAPFFTIAGAGDYDNPSREHYFSMHTQRTYFKEAGTYSFVLEAQPLVEKGGTAVTNIINPALTAVYLPTAYGAVSPTGE